MRTGASAATMSATSSTLGSSEASTTFFRRGSIRLEGRPSRSASLHSTLDRLWTIMMTPSSVIGVLRASVVWTLRNALRSLLTVLPAFHRCRDPALRSRPSA
jgi:hypothetical protein